MIATRFVIFGLTVTSSWGNGHATTWRGLIKALHRAGHQVTFFERDVPYYAAARDLPEPAWCDLVLYRTWEAILPTARRALQAADVAIVTSFCPDGIAAGWLVAESAVPVRAFYDIDTPVTLAALEQDGIATVAGARYLSADLIPEYDLYLSFTGGPTLDLLKERWRARRTAPLYCSVDPEVHRRVALWRDLACDLGYLGTYSPDRQPGVDRLLGVPAVARPADRFLVVGSLYPESIGWPSNVTFLPHLPPADHSAFYSSNRITLNITRAAMIAAGYSPSVRLFEAASCGTPILTDSWPGLDAFFTPGEEILVAGSPDDALAALDRTDDELTRLAQAARERTLQHHTAERRAQELVNICETAGGPGSVARDWTDPVGRLVPAARFIRDPAPSDPAP